MRAGKFDGKGTVVADTPVAVKTEESIETVDVAWSGSVMVAARESVVEGTLLMRSVVSVKNENCELSGGVVNVAVVSSSESVMVGRAVSVVSPPVLSVSVTTVAVPEGKVIVAVPVKVPVAVSVAVSVTTVAVPVSVPVTVCVAPVTVLSVAVCVTPVTVFSVAVAEPVSVTVFGGSDTVCVSVCVSVLGGAVGVVWMAVSVLVFVNVFTIQPRSSGSHPVFVCVCVCVC